MASELVRFNEATKSFEVSTHAVNILRSLAGPVCVVSICGRARQGKSFLLNQLLRRLQPSPVSNRFAVGSTVKPCTKGLWLWSHPVPRTAPDGQTFHVVLVDAEGIDSYDQTADYSNHVFSLALLLSSVLVYNQIGSIDESSVDKLASVCEFARLIWGRAATSPASAGAGSSSGSGGRGSAEDLNREGSPALIWLLRDFQLQLDEDGRQITLREYMERVLQEQTGTSEAIRGKNQLRASIKARFADRECHALVRPVHEEARLVKLDTLPPSELRPEFRQGLDALVDLVLSRCRPKSLRGSLLTGRALAGLAEAYCRIINSGGLPAIASTWQGVVQLECGRALDAATDLYRSRMETARRPEVGLEALDRIHSAALEAGVEAFLGQAVGQAPEQEPFLRRLREAAAALVAPLRQAKRAESEARAVELLTGAARRFSAGLRGEDSDLAAAEAQLHDFLHEYDKAEGLGPDKYMLAAEFLAGTVVPELRVLAQAARSRALTYSQRVSELEAKVAELTRGSVELRGSMDASTLSYERWQRELSAAKAAEAAASAEAAAARAAAEATRRDAAALREQLEAARVDLASRSEAPGLETMRLRSTLATAQSQRQAAEAAAQAAAARAAAAAQQLAAREAELAARAGELAEACRVAEAARAAEAQARRHAESLATQLASRDATLANLQRERDFLQASLDQQEHSRPAAMTAAAPPTGRRGDGGGGGGGGGRGRSPAAAVPAAPPRGRGGKRGRGQEGALDAADVDMVDAGADDDGGSDSDVVELEVLEATPGARARRGAAAATTTPAAGLQPQRRQRTGTGGREQPDTTAAAAAAAAAVTPAGAAAAGPSGSGGGGGDRSPFSVEREVLRTTKRGTLAEAAAAAAGGAGAMASPTAAATPPTRASAAAAAATAGARAGAGAAAAAVRAGGGGGVDDGGVGGGGSPFRVEREVLRTTPRSAPGSGGVRRDAGASAAAAATSDAPHPPPPSLPADLDKMKVDDLKHWLTIHGFMTEVIDKSRGGFTKKDWVALVRAKCTGSGGAGAGGQRR